MLDDLVKVYCIDPIPRPEINVYQALTLDHYEMLDDLVKVYCIDPIPRPEINVYKH